MAGTLDDPFLDKNTQTTYLNRGEKRNKYFRYPSRSVWFKYFRECIVLHGYM